MHVTRRTIIVHTVLAGRMARTESARTNELGPQIMTMGQLAARLAGGLLRPIDLDLLQETVAKALPTVHMGEMEPIKQLPGMPAAVVGTFDKVWRAGVDIAAIDHPRTAALAALEDEVVRRLPASMKRPAELVQLAIGRICHADQVVGPMEIRGHSEMSPCWRELLSALTEAIPVTWVAGPRHVPAWLRETRVKIVESSPTKPMAISHSCANQQHEVLEAFRWVRKLLADGVPASDIAIVASSPGDADDHVLAQISESNLPIHAVQGIKALATADGQAAAALAEILAKGITQERVRRLFALLRGSPALNDLPTGWTRLLPADAPLSGLERWEQLFARRQAADWPDGKDRSAVVLNVLRLLDCGLEVAEEAGEKLLTGVQRSLWRRALRDGPTAALPVTLGRLKVADSLDPAVSVIWCSAIDLASSPRPYVWLLGINAGRWPRRISEDRLIPDHVIPIEELDPLPVADGDKRDFATIMATATTLSLSYSRRGADGRLLGRSPLLGDPKDDVYLERGRTPEHAASEADRLLARPSEFDKLPIAISGITCWRNWYRNDLTVHDGLIAPAHPRLVKRFEQSLSATSLKLLLRDPIRFVWRYALGWKEPKDADEPMTLEPLAFGNFVHGVLRIAVDEMERNGGLTRVGQATIESEVAKALERMRRDWESEFPVPPAVIWRNAVDLARVASTAALTIQLPPYPEQRSWTEIPFGNPDENDENDGGRDLPWRTDQQVEIPGTGLRINGKIDRLDLSGDHSNARVLDYKTGKINKKMADVVIKGGSELQRCLYAFAVKTLIDGAPKIESALLYPHAPEGEQALFPLVHLDAALTKVAGAIALSRDALLAGTAVPGIDAKDTYNEFAFALPANAGYLPRKLLPAQDRLGPAAAIWSEP
jgi:hypothetical protein